MKLDRSVQQGTLQETATAVRAAEADGYDGVYASELAHDPFLPLAVAAEHSDRIELMTCIAVAFARNPMTLAAVAHDLHRFSGLTGLPSRSSRRLRHSPSKQGGSCPIAVR